MHRTCPWNIKEANMHLHVRMCVCVHVCMHVCTCALVRGTNSTKCRTQEQTHSPSMEEISQCKSLVSAHVAIQPLFQLCGNTVVKCLTTETHSGIEQNRALSH
jgi:hypothetical protein